MENTNREMLIEQVKLKEEIQKLTNINIVTCGNCGHVILHKMFAIGDKYCDINCPYCNFISEICDFPDLLYKGIENISGVG